MAWYDIGTVSVTNGSTTVTGSGTNFIAGAQIGEAFYGPDERLYEIQAIVSATVLTLGSPYLGSTQTGQAYYIIPTQSLVATLANEVSSLITDFQSVADLAGAGKFANGTAALPGITFNLDQDTGFSRPAANQIGFSTAGVQRALLSSTALTLNVPVSGTTGSFSGDATIHGATVGRGGGAILTNTAVGFSALQSNTTGFSNTANGRDALRFNTTGTSNTATGRDALRFNTTGGANTANGQDALRDNTTGIQNTANGRSALFNNTTGNNNTANGRDALRENTEGSNNTANGLQALFSNTTGTGNTVIGVDAGSALTTGNDNTIIGRIAGTAGLANTVIIGAGTAERMRIDSAGNVGIGTSSPDSLLHVSGADPEIFLTDTSTGVDHSIDGNSGVGNLFLHVDKNNEGSDPKFVLNVGSASNVMVANNSGNVGIGTSSPSAKLDVSADALIHGTTVGRGGGAISTNTAVGSGALSSNTTGSNNTANGRLALRDNTTGNDNTANGLQALQSNTTGNNNTATGRDALRFNTTGSDNTANGRLALQNNTTGSNNTANGRLALFDNTTGAGNTANGVEALQLNTTGNENTATGRRALFNNTTGDSNTANGRDSLRENTTGDENTAYGRSALLNNTTGFQNIATGRLALFDNTTGSNNIGIGVGAGRSTSPRTITTQSNEICIGNNDHTGAFIKIGFTVTSDARDKAELAPIPHGLDFVNALQPTEYQFKAGGRDGEADGIRRYGFLAQDVLAAEGDTPVIVNNDDPDSLKMTHDYLIPVLVNAVKELTAQVNDLMAEVAALKGQ